MSPRTAQLTAILTYCPACDQYGIAGWDHTPGFTIDDILPGLRSRCPDCGAAGRSATPLPDGPDETEHPELAATWRDMQQDAERQLMAGGRYSLTSTLSSRLENTPPRWTRSGHDRHAKSGLLPLVAAQPAHGPEPVSPA